MDQLIKRLQNSINQNSSTKDNYDCELCQDKEWILNHETNSARECKCREAKQYQRILDSSGISEAFQKKNFGNFNPINETVKSIKDMAMKYVMDFKEIKENENNSIAFLGQVGSGKTHLSIAIANNLMKQNIGVRYMQYREDIMKIKQSAVDEIAYNREINKYKTASVLLVDDLYKGAVSKNRMGYEVANEADLRAMFEIINYRYLKKLPIIVSSEFTTDRLLSFDEAIGSRIIQMCKGRIVELKGQELNYRLGGLN